MKRTPSTLIKAGLILSTIFAISACGGDGGSENLFTKSFEPKNGQAAIARTTDSLLGYWENTNDNQITIRVKIEESKLTVAIKCVEYDMTAQDSASATVDQTAKTVSTKGKISDASQKSLGNGQAVKCVLGIGQGAQFSYEFANGGMDVFVANGGQFQGHYNKLADLEK